MFKLWRRLLNLLADFYIDMHTNDILVYTISSYGVLNTYVALGSIKLIENNLAFNTIHSFAEEKFIFKNYKNLPGNGLVEKKKDHIY